MSGEGEESWAYGVLVDQANWCFRRHGGVVGGGGGGGGGHVCGWLLACWGLAFGWRLALDCG